MSKKDDRWESKEELLCPVFLRPTIADGHSFNERDAPGETQGNWQPEMTYFMTYDRVSSNPNRSFR